MGFAKTVRGWGKSYVQWWSNCGKTKVKEQEEYVAKYGDRVGSALTDNTRISRPYMHMAHSISFGELKWDMRATAGVLLGTAVAVWAVQLGVANNDKPPVVVHQGELSSSSAEKRDITKSSIKK